MKYNIENIIQTKKREEYIRYLIIFFNKWHESLNKNSINKFKITKEK